jgi:NAD(P)-dependent dehydrogenase (short-subunit alcohol dehydrogenase family)
LRLSIRRAGTEREIGDVIWWVAGSTYMTGATIPTDGGLMSTF